jgi:peroxiredoxin
MHSLAIAPVLLSGFLLACNPTDAQLARAHAATINQIAKWRSATLPKDQPAPDFRLMDATGKAVAMRDFRGKVVYLDFWYSGCRPCLAEAPAADKLKQQFVGQDVAFVYVSTETSVDAWKLAVEKHHLSSTNSVHLIDPEGWHAARAYHVVGFPTYMIIGRDGRIWQTEAPRPSDGAATVSALEQALASKRGYTPR